jgi:hypothetical protein
MTQPQNVEIDGPNPPQLDSLEAATEVVSLSIGGNDIGFSEIAQSCITLNPFQTPCRDKYTAGGKDQIAERIAATAAKVAAVLQGIHVRSPEARVYLLDYPAIFPPTGFGCWPQMPIGFGDVPYLRAKQLQLNSMLANQAARQRRHPGPLVPGEHRPRRLQEPLRPLGGAVGPEQPLGADPSQPGRYEGRCRRPRLGGSCRLTRPFRASSHRETAPRARLAYTATARGSKSSAEGMPITSPLKRFSRP